MVFLTGMFCFVIAQYTVGQDSTEGDLKKMQGTWKVIRFSNSNAARERIEKEWIAKGKVVCKDDTLTGFIGEKQKGLIGKIRLDPSKKPKTIDIVLENPDAAPETVLGIYEFEGETWRLCVDPKKRPTEFKIGEGQGDAILELKKPAKAP
jgi:uncharacterized protein (TIGR03067 family)